MLRYFIRRLIGGAITFFLAVCLLYTTLLNMPLASPDTSIHRPPVTEVGIRLWLKSYVDTFELDRAWPLSFAAYLFDPGETTEIDTLSGKTFPKGLQVSILGMEIAGSGLLTGDFGRSLAVSRGEPVMGMMGPGLDVALALLISLIVTFMYVATIQRVGRPAPYISRQSATPAHKLRLVLGPASFTLKG